MSAIHWIVTWGVIALLACAAGGVIARMKNRDTSHWAAWCFLVPPVVLVLLMLSKRQGPQRRRPTLDEEDQLPD